jgi:hypothetical protein
MADARANFEAATREKYRGTPSSAIVSFPDRTYYAFELSWREEDVRSSFRFYFGEEPDEIVRTGAVILAGPIARIHSRNE